MRGTLDQLAGWMREQGVRRVRLPDGLEMELDPFVEERRRNAEELARHSAAMDGKPTASADERPAPVVQALADADGAGTCACGHSWIEHAVDGCLRGCSHDVCTSSATSEPEPVR